MVPYFACMQRWCNELPLQQIGDGSPLAPAHCVTDLPPAFRLQHNVAYRTAIMSALIALRVSEAMRTIIFMISLSGQRRAPGTYQCFYRMHKSLCVEEAEPAVARTPGKRRQQATMMVIFGLELQMPSTFACIL